MFQAISMAATGLRHQQMRMDSIANNISNANTIAFKNARMDFRTAMYTTGRTPGPTRNPQENQQTGHGVMVAGNSRDWRGGSMQRTERQLDFSIENEGFFVIQNPDGSQMFTRDGSFALSAEPGGGLYLTNSQGLYVLGADSQRIGLPAGTTEMEVDTNGNIRFTRGSDVLGTGTIGVVTFRNLKGLESVGNSNFAAGASAGEMLPATNAIVRQGTLEMSNVNLSEEMTRIIRTQRAFQLASRALTTADEMEGIANNMRR